MKPTSKDFARTVNDLSGWLLPSGLWLKADDWWHVSALYDLKDGLYPECKGDSLLLQCPHSKAVFAKGEEDVIREHVAHLGFVKFSRCQLEGVKINRPQLSQLQRLLAFCSPEDEISVVCGNRGVLRQLSLLHLAKLKNPDVIFAGEENQIWGLFV